jgi:hypothetical protein
LEHLEWDLKLGELRNLFAAGTADRELGEPAGAWFHRFFKMQHKNPSRLT